MWSVKKGRRDIVHTACKEKNTWFILIDLKRRTSKANLVILCVWQKCEALFFLDIFFVSITMPVNLQNFVFVCLKNILTDGKKMLVVVVVEVLNFNGCDTVIVSIAFIPYELDSKKKILQKTWKLLLLRVENGGTLKANNVYNTIYIVFI